NCARSGARRGGVVIGQFLLRCLCVVSRGRPLHTGYNRLRLSSVLISIDRARGDRMAIPRPTTRLLALLELLQPRDWISGAELARRLEVNGRSVRRYIAMLDEIGIPVEAMRGRAGGYRLRPGYKLPPLLFTDEEAVALALALQVVPRLGLALTP